jgi:hypothetical protein
MNRLTWPREGFSLLLLTFVLTVFAVAPLTYPGYIQVHSGFIPVYNLTDLASRPPDLRWTPHIATSFDPLRGDGLLPYYLALPVVWLGGTPWAGVKLIFVLSFLLGAGGVFFWLQRPLGPAGAALAALVYTYLPYHIAAVYVRGAWGESLCLGLLPWALAVFSEVSPHPYRRAILAALMWAFLGLSQPGLAIWSFLLLAWMIFTAEIAVGTEKTKKISAHSALFAVKSCSAILAALGGLAIALILTCLAARFSLPGSPIHFFDHFLYPAQLFSAYWGFGASRPGWDDGLALGFGFAAVGLTMLTLFLALRPAQDMAHRIPYANVSGLSRLSESSQDSNSFNRLNPLNPLTFLIPALVLTLLLFPPSAFLWQLTGLHNTLTYPWQLLGLIGLCLSVLAGASVRLDARLATLPVQAGLILLTLLASYSYLEPRFTQHSPGSGPLAIWDANRLMLLDCALAVDIPPAAAGLSEPTPGYLPLEDYGRPRPGDTLRLTITWQATLPFNRDLKLFVHLLDSSGQIIAQVDPLAGAGAGPEGTDYFTSHWDPGKIILDDVAVTIPPAAPPGPYRLAFGLYDGDTLERLPVMGRGDGSVVLQIE